MKTRFAALLSFILVVAACSPAGSTGGDIALARADVPRASTSPEDAAAAATAISAFGLDLYRAVAKGQANVVLSPTSVALALAMARAGARGETAAEMDAVMRGLGSDDNAAWLNALDVALATRSGTFKDAGGQDLAVALRIANAPFAQKNMPLEKAYLEALASRFGAGLRLVDYIWPPRMPASSSTAGSTSRPSSGSRSCSCPGVLTPETRLALVNAIYLKAPWQTPFAAAATRPGTFNRADGTTVEVPMMQLGEALPLRVGDRLASGGDPVRRRLPRDDGHRARRPGRLRAGADGRPARVDHGDPRGSAGVAHVPEVLDRDEGPAGRHAEGARHAAAFDERADFSGITTAEQLQISDVIHQANIDVDEKGTEAAAATAVVMRAGAAPAEPVTIRADRPFHFALRDVPTGAILFLGRVADPSSTR